MKQGMAWKVVGLALGLLVVLVGGCGPREAPTGYTEEVPAVRTATGTGELPQWTVGMRGSRFTPVEMVAPSGTTITFLNNCTETHTVTPDKMAPGAPNSDEQYPNGMAPGESYTWTVPANAANGTRWYYHCRFHGQPGDGTEIGSGMAGAVRVGTVVTAAPAATEDEAGAVERGPVSPWTPGTGTTAPGY